MTTSLRTSMLGLGLYLGLAAMIPVHTSCAADGESSASPVPDAEPPSEVSIPSSSDARDSGEGPATPACSEVDWCPVETGVEPAYALTAIWASGPNDVWAVGSGGSAIRWAGVAWQTVPTGTSSTLLSVWGSGPNDIWAVGTADVILHGAGGSSGFSLAPEAARSFGARLYTAWGTSASDVRLAGAPVDLWDANEIYIGSVNQWRRTTTDGGVGWTSANVAPDGMNLTIHGMWGAASDDVWLVGDNSKNLPWMAGTTLHAVGQGEDGAPPSFVSVDSQTTAALEAIWGSAADDVWTVGAHGTIRHYTPGALRFAIVDSPVTANLHAVWGTGPNDVWAVGDEGTVIHFDGAAWTISSTGLARGRKPNLNGVSGSGPNDVWAVGGTVALHFTGMKPSVDGGSQ